MMMMMMIIIIIIIIIIIEIIMAWPPQLDFWMRRGCYKDFAAYVGRAMRLRLEEEPLHRQL